MVNHYFRNLRVIGEKRLATDPEYKPFVRGKRSARNIPNDWDDYCRGRRKVYTKRQKIRSRHNFRDSIRKMIMN